MTSSHLSALQSQLHILTQELASCDDAEVMVWTLSSVVKAILETLVEQEEAQDDAQPHHE